MQQHKHGQVGLKHVAINAILMLFQIKERLWTVLSCTKDGCEWVSDASMQQHLREQSRWYEWAEYLPKTENP
jgi:hypothetical protein